MVPIDNEQRERFLTYKHYVGALALELRDGWGTTTKVFATTFDASRQRCTKVRRSSVSPGQVLPLLSRGWSHLLTLWRDTEEDFYEEVNAWTPAKAWYAVHHGFTALLPHVAPQELSKDRTHEQTLKLLRQLVTQRKLCPPPFDLYVTGYGADTTYHGFNTQPGKISSLTDPYNASFEDYAGLVLRRTADHRSERVIRAWRKETSRKNVLAKYRPEIAKRLGPTTIFDLLYRLRTRANYGDVDTFVEGAEDLEEARRFTEDLLVVTDAAFACIEGILTAYIGVPVYRKALISYVTSRRFKASSPVGRRLKHVGPLRKTA